MQDLALGVVGFLLFFSVAVRLPLVGVLVIAAGIVLPLPKAACGYLSTSAACGVQPAITVALEEPIPVFFQFFLLAIIVLIPLGMEQSRWRNELYDLEGQIAFYKSYHSETINKAIHLVCIPLILWSAIGVYSYTEPIFGSGSPAALDWSAVIAALYAVYYFRMTGKLSFVMGTIASALVAAMWIHVQSPYRPSTNTLLWVHCVAWVLQFWGHGVHEKRAPALLTNLSQALLMGPLFVFLEACFWLGWQPAFYSRVTALSRDRIAKFDKPKAS